MALQLYCVICIRFILICISVYICVCVCVCLYQKKKKHDKITMPFIESFTL